MLQQNCLYPSVQLKMVSLLIKNGKILMKHQVYNKGIFTNFGYFSMILILLEYAVDSD